MAKERHVLKKEIYDEINGIGRSGFESGMWFTSFRENYYEKIQYPDDKAAVRDILTKFLRNEDYGADFLNKVAHIYTDLEIPGYEDEIKRLSTDKRMKGNTWFKKVLLDDITVEKELVSGLSQLKSESNPTSSRDFFDKAIAFYKKLRGDVSKMYASKEAMEKTEADFLRSYIIGRLIKLVRSIRYDAIIKINAALVLSDLNVRSAVEEIEKLSHDPKMIDDSYIKLIEQSLAHLRVR
jgi:hypothetical protein